MLGEKASDDTNRHQFDERWLLKLVLDSRQQRPLPVRIPPLGILDLESFTARSTIAVPRVVVTTVLVLTRVSSPSPSWVLSFS